MKEYKFSIIIAIILFFIPFFWLAPGEVNLGGDSGRLYFYDPGAYLDLHAFYNYLESGFGNELTYYIYLPFVFFLFLLKFLFNSPTILISIFNGLVLGVGFFSVYLILKELIWDKKNLVKSIYAELASILGGLFYILSQISMYSGWQKPIITFNQMFLNPLMALIMLRFILTQKIKYLIFAIFISFIFTPNFSIVGSPPFFAFYPITIIFVIFYARFVRKVPIRWKFLLFMSLLFVLAHAFQLFTTMESIFSSGSSYNQTIFAKDGEAGSRNALTYFVSVYGTVRESRIWLSLSQFQNNPYFGIFIIFPIISVISFILNRGKTLLLTGLFFLASFYLASAVTDTGFFLYKLFFRIPGFTIFRNFHAQWSYVFFFFYALLLGQAIAIVLNRLGRKLAFASFIILGVIIVGFGLPLLSGAVSMPVEQDAPRDSKFRMDSTFEHVLKYFRSSSVNGKVLMLPLTVPGYQILQGEDGGIYRGLPMISYIGGKAEFGGYETLGLFKNIFLDSMKKNDYNTLGRLLSAMNIKWIFYNSDPYIYSDAFNSLYGHVLNFAPQNQDQYEAFIDELPVLKIKDFGDKYHIYTVKDDVYTPLIFTTNDIVFTNNDIDLMFNPSFQKNAHSVTASIQNGARENDPIIVYGSKKSLFASVTDDSHFHKHSPYVNRKLDDLYYPFILIKEEFDLTRIKKNFSAYVDYSLFLLSKRIEELRAYGVNMDIGSKNWQKPSIWEINKWFSYNSWNASLLRYEKAANNIIKIVDNYEISDEDKFIYKLKINEQFYQHEIVLLNLAYELDKKVSEKTYLISYIDKMYKDLYRNVAIPIVDSSLYTYRFPYYSNGGGEYEVYMQSENQINKDQGEEAYVQFEDQILKPIYQYDANTLLRFQDVTLKNKNDLEMTIKLPVVSLIEEARWDNSGSFIQDGKGITTMSLNNTAGYLTQGLNLKIPDWVPGSTYIISFDYNTNGNNFIFSSIEKNPLKDSIKKVAQKILFEKRLNSTAFTRHQSIIVAEQGSSEGFLRIVPFSPNDVNAIRVRNLVVQRIDYPQLVLKKVIAPKANQLLPQITFTKINPTKYEINVRGASNPYALIFMQSFNDNWKLFNKDSGTDSLRGGISRIVGSMGRLLMSFLAVNDSKEKIAASYFENRVKEMSSKNIFLNSKTFDTWGKNTVADYSHTLVDGYANSWYIKPGDMDEKTDYTLILELRTQKPFYATIIISLLTMIYLLAYPIIRLIWRKK